MAKRRPSGDGMVRKRDDGRWEGRIVVGHKEDGDSIFRYLYAGTQKELTAKLRQNIDIYQGIDLTEQSRMTLAEWLEQWLGQMSATLRPSTLEHYRRDMENHVIPYLGKKMLSQVTAADLRKLYDSLKKNGRVNPRPGQDRGLSSNGPLNRPFSNCDHCAGWAMLCSDAAFGTLPWKRITDPSWEQIRPGDLIHYDNSTSGHVVVVVKKTDGYIKVTESGLDNKVRWGGQYFKWWLEEQPAYAMYTHYPQESCPNKMGGGRSPQGRPLNCSWRVCPCEAVCAHPPGPMASVSLPQEKHGVGPFVRRCAGCNGH